MRRRPPAILAVLTAALFTSAAHAAPIYLTCTMTSGQEDLHWDVTLDEAGGTVSYAIPSLNVLQKYPAVFTPDKVLFDTMEISRVDLTLKRTTKILDEVRVDIGRCALATPPAKRKF